MRSLYACLWIPDFPAAVLLRGEWNRRVPPVAVFTGSPPNCFVYAANEPARRGGVREGMPLAEAVARYGLARSSQRQATGNHSNGGSGRPLRDEVKGKGIKPYRLRPTAPGAGASADNSLRSQAPGQSRLPLSSGRGADGSLAELQTRERSPEAEQQAQQELVGMALTVSPRVEDAAPGMLIVDLAGMSDPHSSASQLAHYAEKLGFPTHVGVSENRFVATAAAQTQQGVTHIFPGQEPGFLSVLSLDVLPLDPREQEVFARWGIRTVGDLARLPEDSLVARFGTRGGQLSRLARGRQEAVMCPYEPPPALEEKSDIDWQIVELEPLAFLLSGLLDRLCMKLQGHNLAAAEIRVALKLADGSHYERAVAMSHPLADPRTLLTLVRIDLAAHPPGDAIEGVTVAAQPAPRRLTQFSLLDPTLPSPEKLAVTLARLAHLVGPGRVGAPAVPDTHRPGAFRVEVFEVKPGVGSSARKEKTLALPRREARLALPAAGTAVAERDAEQEVEDRQGDLLVFPELRVRHRNDVVGEAKQLGVGTARDDARKNRLSNVVVFTAPPQGDERNKSNPDETPRGSLNQPSPADPRITRSTDQPVNGSKDPPIIRTFHAFRCFRPSVEAEVLLRGPLPVFVDSIEVHGPVRTRSGPWRVCGEWWAEGWQFEEWDVEVRGRLYRICCELPSRRWYVTGIYD